MVTWTFAGDPQVRAPAQIAEIMQYRSVFHPEIIFAFRFHPAHPRAEELWQRTAVSGLRVIDARTDNLLDLCAASNFVVADYVSTDPYKLLFLGVPVATTRFPDDLPYRIELGYPDGVPPILMGYEGWGTESAQQVAGLLQHIHKNPHPARRVTFARSQVFRWAFLFYRCLLLTRL